MGSLNILNVAGGDIKISFDTKNVSEAIRAKRIIKDMMRRGYSLLIQNEDGTHTRALDFDETKGEYIIADYDNSQEEIVNEQIKNEENWIKGGKEVKKPKASRKRVGMESATTYAVAPSAGG